MEKLIESLDIRCVWNCISSILFYIKKKKIVNISETIRANDFTKIYQLWKEDIKGNDFTKIYQLWKEDIKGNDFTKIYQLWKEDIKGNDFTKIYQLWKEDIKGNDFTKIYQLWKEDIKGNGAILLERDDALSSTKSTKKTCSFVICNFCCWFIPV